MRDWHHLHIFGKGYAWRLDDFTIYEYDLIELGIEFLDWPNQNHDFQDKIINEIQTERKRVREERRKYFEENPISIEEISYPKINKPFPTQSINDLLSEGYCDEI